MGGTARLASTFSSYESGATFSGKLLAMQTGVAGTLQSEADTSGTPV